MSNASLESILFEDIATKVVKNGRIITYSVEHRSLPTGK